MPYTKVGLMMIDKNWNHGEKCEKEHQVWFD
jgi:hypothetical protein